jgi:FeoB-associated Cys-rich membrane protein
MMQTFVVVTIVAAAAVFVLRRAWVSVRRARKPQSACGDCGCSQSH